MSTEASPWPYGPVCSHDGSVGVYTVMSMVRLSAMPGDPGVGHQCSHDGSVGVYMVMSMVRLSAMPGDQIHQRC